MRETVGEATAKVHICSNNISAIFVRVEYWKLLLTDPMFRQILLLREQLDWTSESVFGYSRRQHNVCFPAYIYIYLQQDAKSRINNNVILFPNKSWYDIYLTLQPSPFHWLQPTKQHSDPQNAYNDSCPIHLDRSTGTLRFLLRLIEITIRNSIRRTPLSLQTVACSIHVK